jgi:hypothetical protein
MPDLLGTQGALSLQVCGIDGMAQPAALRARGRGSRSVQKRFLCGEETRHPDKYLRRMQGAGLRQQGPGATSTSKIGSQVWTAPNFTLAADGTLAVNLAPLNGATPTAVR